MGQVHGVDWTGAWQCIGKAHGVGAGAWSSHHHVEGGVHVQGLEYGQCGHRVDGGDERPKGKAGRQGIK